MPIEYPAGVNTVAEKRAYREQKRESERRQGSQPRRRRSREKSPKRRRTRSPEKKRKKASQNGNLRHLHQKKQMRRELNVGEKRISGGVEN